MEEKILKIIQLKDVWKVYKLSEEVSVEAVKGISLDIERGEFLAITGPSGSGKSTLMHLIGCLDTPTKGTILLEGEDVQKMNPGRLAKIRGKKIGFVFQNYNLIPSLNALRNVEMPMLFQGVKKSEMRERAEYLLELVGLGERKTHRPNQLSGGEQQRVGIARALANDPDVILADEPTGNLDTKHGKEILKILENLNKEGKTIVIVTHDNYIAKETRRIVKIRDGRILSDKRLR